VAFTIGAPGCSAQRKHIALAPADIVGVLLGRSARGSRSRERHAEGERRAAAILARLPETYVVFNDFAPAPGHCLPAKWRIDHVVIGPSGVFAIETECSDERRVGPASVSRSTLSQVRSVQRHAAEFRDALSEWSCGSFGDVFVKPMLVYAHDNAYIEKLQEGPVKVIPLKWLATEVTERSFEQLTPDRVYRIAHALFEQLPETLQQASQPELDRLGAIAHAWLTQQVYPQLVLPYALD
jgi:Nuclease-related domain